MPFNPYVELFENRIGITFEVDPSYSVATTVPFDILQLIIPTALVAILLYIIGKLIIP